MTDKDEVTFHVSAIKKNGDARDSKHSKINHAIRALWRIRDEKEVYVSEYKNGRLVKLLAKIGRRRGINAGIAKIPQGRPKLKIDGGKWSRLPNRFNDLD